VKWTEERLSEALDAIRWYGCVTNRTLARALGIEPKHAVYVLYRLTCEGRIAVYPLGAVYAYCAGPPGVIAVTCNDAIVYLDVRRIAGEVMCKIERGTRVVRPSRLEGLRPLASCPVLMSAAWHVLRAVLDDSAMVTVIRHKRALVVHNPRAALERLRQAVESGVLPLEPVSLPCRQKGERRRKETAVAITVYMPEALVRELDALVASGAYKNRSAAVREAVRVLLRGRGGHD
jgi:hypothetical protein